jgi:hypothetical protein
MMRIRPSAARGHFDHGWLDTYHTFSFADYYDPAHMGFRSLRVINEDRVQPRTGFGQHPHRDMEIITVVVAGELEHRDSLGSGGVIRPGDVQYMSAGRGILHSETNPSSTDAVHLLQIWIEPNRRGGAARYDQRRFPGLTGDAGDGDVSRAGAGKHGSGPGNAETGGRPEADVGNSRSRQARRPDATAADPRSQRPLTLLASPDGREGSIAILQDAALYAVRLPAGATVRHTLAPGRHAWVQVISGALAVGGAAAGRGDGTLVAAGDGLAVSDEAELQIDARDTAAALLFELA